MIHESEQLLSIAMALRPYAYDGSEALYQTVYQGIEELYGAPGAVSERVMEVKKELEKAGRIDPRLADTAKRVAETSYLIEDIVTDLRTYLKTVSVDEARLEAVEARIDTLQKLKRKYGGSLEKVIAYLNSIEQELSEIENLTEKIEQTSRELEKRYEALSGLASALSSKRGKRWGSS